VGTPIISRSEFRSEFVLALARNGKVTNSFEFVRPSISCSYQRGDTDDEAAGTHE
jgi:hypothetical protein